LGLQVAGTPDAAQVARWEEHRPQVEVATIHSPEYFRAIRAKSDWTAAWSFDWYAYPPDRVEAALRVGVRLWSGTGAQLACRGLPEEARLILSGASVKAEQPGHL
jgi:hypothetical protein